MMFKTEQLKTTMGKYRVQSLFYELSYMDTTYCIFTLKDDDYEVDNKRLLSLKKLFLSFCVNDPTEYTFSQVVFGSWDNWRAIFSSPKMKDAVEGWRNELIVKIKSEAIKTIATEMQNPESKNSFQAAKLMLDKGWMDKEAASKAKKKLKEKEDEEQDREALGLLAEDAQRLGLKIN